MAAYLFANVEIFDAPGFQDYQSKVAPTLQAYGGRFVVRGGRSEVLEGEFPLHRMVMLEFPSYELAKQWYDSPGYAPLIPMRQKTARTAVIVMEGV